MTPDDQPPRDAVPEVVAQRVLARAHPGVFRQLWHRLRHPDDPAVRLGPDAPAEDASAEDTSGRGQRPQGLALAPAPALGG